MEHVRIRVSDQEETGLSAKFIYQWVNGAPVEDKDEFPHETAMFRVLP